jgi:bifunctional non-homologous end joining protein LigD
MPFPPNLRPMRLSRRREPFNSPDWLFEIKHDGFRALAFIEGGQCQLVSRNGNVFRRFAELAQNIVSMLRATEAVLDGEIVCVDESGRTIFNDLLFGRSECRFFAFDLLWLDGEDLRELPLMDRKRRLRRLIGRRRSLIHYVDHIETHGCGMLREACRMDLEGIVAKRSNSLYRATEKPSPQWVKIKNPTYSQAEGRQEMFEEAVGRSK